MFARLIFESFRRQQRRKLLAGLAVTLGVSVATAMIAVATNIGDRINSELRSYGANLAVYPDSDALEVEIGGVNLRPATDGAYLAESDLPAIKGTFWRHNITGFSPMMPVQVDLRTPQGKSARVELIGTYFRKPLRFGEDAFTTGVTITHPWWRVSPAWPTDDSYEVAIGERFASVHGLKPGDVVTVSGLNLKVAGIVSTGGPEDHAIIAPLSLAQQILGKPGAVRRVLVSALTVPEDDFARRDPKTMTPEQYDRWYCTPYVNAIAHQIMEAIPRSRAEQIRQVAQNEGIVLSRIKGLMMLVTVAALIASALAVSAAMATAIFERRREIGLMKALGAGNTSIGAMFFTESALLGLFGGLAGFIFGSMLARQIGLWIFDTQIAIQPLLLPFVLGIAIFVTFAGSAASIRRAMSFDPVFALRGDA